MFRYRGVALVALTLAAVAPASAQITGGEDPSRQPSAPKAKAPTIKGGFYIRGGTLAATGDYGQLPSQTGQTYYTPEAAEPVFNSGAGATDGYYGEIGRLTYVGIPTPAIMKVGLDFAASAGYMNIDWAGIYGQEAEEAYGELIADVRLGPALTIMPLRGLRLDASLKFGAGVAAGSGSTVSGSDFYVEDSHEEGATGASRSFTLGARFAGLTVGWETHSLAVERTRTYSASGYDQSGDFTYTATIPASTSRLFIGFSR